MAVDTPATIAILGAGPMGIEAGLYARYLGYSVVIFEQREVASHVLAWGHLRMFSPFAELCSSLGLAALRAQDAEYHPPDADARLTGRQWVDKYLLPLSRTDLLADEIRCHARVLAVGRQHVLKHELASDKDRSEDGFRILVEHAQGEQTHELADIVIDCTGVYGHPNWCGAGGIPARGEWQVRQRIEYGVPDILGAMRSDYEGRRVLVVGDGLAAAATIVALVKLAHRVPETHVTWISHREMDAGTDGPICVAQFDRLPERQRMAMAANKHARAGTAYLDFRPGTAIVSIDFDNQDEQFVVHFGNDISPARFDRIIANVGYRPDHSLCEELWVAQSPITGGPAGLAEHPADDSSVGDPGRIQLRPERLVTPEPNFYMLGAKSFGRDSRFLMTDGFRQLRDLFAIIGGRRELDLYASAEKLAR